MKKILLFFVVFAFTKANLFAQYPDLPGPGGNYNLQTLPTGSYVIAMDNLNQSNAPVSVFTIVVNNRTCVYFSGNTVMNCTNTSGILVGMGVTGQGAIPAGAVVTAIVPNVSITISLAPTANSGGGGKALDFGNFSYSASGFNLKVYGLLVTLLNNNIKLKWVIKPGKALDANDFSVNATQVKPTLGSAANFDFAGGPFVIFQPDTAGVAALVQTFNNANAPDVKMYKTNADVPVDVRYDYNSSGTVWKPKAAVLNDGGNATIHLKYMTNASIPTANYTTETTPKFVTNCYTFACEPHNTVAPDSVIQGIRTFVTSGGNFLAECAAVRTYELSTFARFQSTNGFDNVNENGDPTSWTYSNTDLGYFQINGYFGIADEGGSLKDWVIPQSPGNPPLNNFYYHTSGSILKNGLVRPYTNASVSKLLTASQLGGMVFYLGSHSYDGTLDYDINGQRLFMNALLTPTDPQGSLKNTNFLQCQHNQDGTLTSIANVGSQTNPINAYPITFEFYKDKGAAGYQGPLTDSLIGSFTATADNMQTTITGPATNLYSSINYLIRIVPASSCFGAKVVTSSCSTLPVDLLSFTASRTNGSLVNLKWVTVNELNSKGFNVERLIGNGTWETIGYLPSRAPGGNSSDELAYYFTDPNNFKGISQYRLQQLDLDGRSRQSAIRAVRGDGQKDKVIIFPNPSDGKVSVLFGDNSGIVRDVTLFDMSGRAIKQWKGLTTNNMQIENLTTGMYSLRIIIPATGEQTVEKIVVNKR